MSAPDFCALVTGATGGIGRAICFQLLRSAEQNGKTLRIAVAAGKPGAALDALVKEMQAAGAQAIGLHADLSQADACTGLARDAIAFCGGLDTLISNAGITRPGALATLAVEDWDRVFNTDTRATLLLAQAAREALAARRGSIVAVASMSGSFPHSGHGAYSAAKAALIMLCRQLAQEWGRDGIRVNTVSPGMTLTPLTAPIYRDETVAQQRKAMVPAGRIGMPEDVARAVCHLAGPDAAYTSGIDLRVDGGLCDTLLSTIPGLARS